MEPRKRKINSDRLVKERGTDRSRASQSGEVATGPVLFDGNQLVRSPISIRCTSLSGSMDKEGMIDLTAESDKEEAVIDLTTPVKRPKVSRVENRDTRDTTTIVIPEQEENEVIILSPPPHHLPPAHHSSQSRIPPSHHAPRNPLPNPPSPQGGISCPICMDSHQVFTKLGHTLVSTKCGHLFCDACIKETIRQNHKCPTCSTKLTLKQFHRIYI